MRKRLFVISSLVLALAVISLAADAPVNVAGTWKFVPEDPTMVLKIDKLPTIVLMQDGARITGTFKRPMRSGTLEGTVEGNNISFQVTTGTWKTDYKGTVDEDTMKGTVTMGTISDMAWTAKRAR